MKFLFDMVHHNPAEPLIVTKYTDAAFLKDLGYNGSVLRNINLTVSCENSCPGLVKQDKEVSNWIEQIRDNFKNQIETISKENIKIYSHIDPFVIPSVITDYYRDEMFDDDGISIYRTKTREVMEDILEEIFFRYPELDGIIIRTGETYLFDSPYHTGNDPIHYFYNKDHSFEDGDISVEYGDRNKDLQREKDDFVYLINFLKDIICIRHGKKLFFRTWDIFEDRLHADSEYYLDVTDRIKPHKLLFFSMKHTRLDFLRRVESNPSIGRGKHNQIIEVQFQREYEGKGAYPNYFAHHLIEGFPETEKKTGFRDFIRSPLVQGLFGWSRGGGWYGPYISNEFWIDLNLQVFIRWIRNPDLEEEQIFLSYLTELGFDRSSRDAIRQIALLSSEAILKGRYCAYGKLDKFWMRDDVIGGQKQLAEGFDILRKAGMVDAALKEKEESVLLWEEIVRLSSRVTHKDDSLSEFIKISCEYGLRLYRVIEKGWQTLIRGNDENAILTEEITAYEQAWENYKSLKTESAHCPTLYRGQYWNWPKEKLTPGLENSIKELKRG